MVLTYYINRIESVGIYFSDLFLESGTHVEGCKPGNRIAQNVGPGGVWRNDTLQDAGMIPTSAGSAIRQIRQRLKGDGGAVRL